MKLLTTCILAVAVLGGCRSNSESQSSPKDSEDNLSTTYECTDSYIDQSIQDTPLWTETFKIDASNGGSDEQLMKKFGVSPDDGSYIATLTKNGDNEVAAVIINTDTNERSMGIYTKGTEKIFLLYMKSDKKILSLLCEIQ